MPVHLAATFDPQHDPLHELWRLQSSVVYTEKNVWVVRQYVWKREVEMSSLELTNPLRPH